MSTQYMYTSNELHGSQKTHIYTIKKNKEFTTNIRMVNNPTFSVDPDTT